jgi:hypothetical protein
MTTHSSPSSGPCHTTPTCTPCDLLHTSLSANVQADVHGLINADLGASLHVGDLVSAHVGADIGLGIDCLHV